MYFPDQWRDMWMYDFVEDPGTLSAQEIEVLLLDSDGPEFEKIRDAASEGDALVVLLDFFDTPPASAEVLVGVIRKIREES